MSQRRVMAFLMTIMLLAGLRCSLPAAVQRTEGGSWGIADVTVHDRLSNAVLQKDVPSAISGRGIGFVRPEDSSTFEFDRPQTEEFRLNEGEAFSPRLILLNGTPQSKTFLVTGVLDYRQVEFSLDTTFGLLHEIIVPAGVQMELPLSLPIGQNGTHDILFAAFDDPYNFTLDPDYRMDLHGRVIARRAVIVVGDDESPARLLTPMIQGRLTPPDITFAPSSVYFAFPTLSGAEHPSRRQLYVDRASTGEPYRFEIVCNNLEPGPTTIAVIAFVDYHQVRTAGKDVIVARLEPNNEAVIEAEVILTPQPAVHQIQALHLWDPYKSILRHETTAASVFGSPRIVVESQQ